jgi:hypothetical protein
MKGLFSKVLGVIVSAVALFSISVTNVKASTPDITGKSALYLEHGKSIASSIDTINWHTSHASHESHESHVSHSSGY